MDDSAILDELLAVLQLNGIPVRQEEMGGGAGGVCRISGKKVCFIDTDSGPSHNAAICADAVNQLVDIELIYLRPAVRQFLKRNQGFQQK